VNFAEAVDQFPQTALFEVTDHEPEDWPHWPLNPLPAATVPSTPEEGFYIVRALHVLDRGRTQGCYLDLSMPERISDFVYFREGSTVTRRAPHDLEGDVIPAVAIEGFGVYEQFYSRRDPEAGLAVLRRGLELAGQKAAIAEDLGYILRDEGRREEAIAMFSIAIEEGPSSDFILMERADLYEALGDRVNAERDRQQAEERRRSGQPRSWWPFKRRT
jgi:tetratricopeptide (TPR) repeat protein